MCEVDIHKKGIGINFNGVESSVCVWAPLATEVNLVMDAGNKHIPLEKKNYGYWKAESTGLMPGDPYKIKVDDKYPVPDPASMFQPNGVHGSSVAVDITRFQWSDEEWKNPPLSNYIIYELHCGTFTETGDFSAIVKKLDHIIELGATAIEIMPVAQFPGERNWGYDGVFPFAVQNSYGGPEELMRLVNACHRKGIAVILDVVYNHLGPEGNYLDEFGPYFTEKYKTPWGPAINFDDEWCDGVRNYFIENALMWFRDFHIDALRLDAVHAIKDLSAVHILREIKDHVSTLEQHTGKDYHLIIESDLNDPRYIDPIPSGGYGMDAQWIDEFHHALRVTSGEQPDGYYSDFEGISHLAKAYKDAYVYDGQFSDHRKRKFGAKTSNDGHQFIVFSQNHDQVGNRMLGERTSKLVSFEMQKLLAAAVILSPYVPLLFMGEEWCETNPFLYFVSHTDPVLAEAVRQGRRTEFASFFSGDKEAPDPMSEKTFASSKLQWHLIKNEPHRTMFHFYQELIQIRKRYSCFSTLERRLVSASADEENGILSIIRQGNPTGLCVMNFSRDTHSYTVESTATCTPILCSANKEWEGPGVISFNPLSQGQSVNLPPESILVCLNV